MKRISRPILISLALQLPPLQADHLPESRPIQVIPVAPPEARTFDLKDVRILDGEFKQGQDIALKYLLSLDPDRLLAGFRREAGLEPKAENYGGWESQGIAGHSLGHYLSGCALGHTTTGDPELLRRVHYIASELAACQKAGGTGYIAAFAGGKKAYADVAAGNIRSSGFDLNGIWVPNYTMHKIFAGLRDAWRLCGSAESLAVSRGLADWFEKNLSGLNEEQMQKVLAAEHGGLNETFADLYADTGDARYLQLSRRFHHRAILDPLVRGEDILPGKHANTQVPKLVGLATRYELTGDWNDRRAAQFFWERVVHHHSYANGGNSDGEHFGPADHLNGRLSSNTAETCNVNNMLKLTAHVFGWKPDAATADYHERALLNQIRSTQHPDGRVMYYLSLKPGFHKEYQSLFESFTCCVGTGMENHVKYGQGIYYHNDDTLWVNLFIASELNWRARKISLHQETRWPQSDRSLLKIRCEEPQEFTLRLRHPFWARTLQVKVNGKVVSDTTSPSSYCQIQRRWNNGDEVEMVFPMSLRTESMPDNPDRIAVFYGPTLLAADLGPDTDLKADRPGEVPVVVTDRPVEEWVKPESSAARNFRTVGVGRPGDFQLVPFHQLHERRYTVYLDRYSADSWAWREAGVRAEEQRIRELEASTLDFFQPGEMQPERDHDVKGEKSDPFEALGRKLRHAYDGGWLSYGMKVDPEKPTELVCTWWGGESGRRTFDVLADGTKLATENLVNRKPGAFWDAIYPLPASVTRGKKSVTIKIQAHPGNFGGGLFGSRTTLAKP